MSHPPGGAAAAAEPGALPGSAPVVLPGFANARDLGGLQTEDGRCTRSGAVIRSEIPRESLASEDLAVALRISFGRVIDLRSDDEVIDTPHPLQPLPGYRHLPLIDPQAELDRDPDAEQSLAQVYCGSVERNTATIGAILAEIAGAPDAPILISCTAGKDRTGMIAAMLLELARVRRPQIGEDYARTEEQLRSAFDGRPPTVMTRGPAGGTPRTASRPISSPCWNTSTMSTARSSTTCGAWGCPRFSLSDWVFCSESADERALVWQSARTWVSCGWLAAAMAARRWSTEWCAGPPARGPHRFTSC